MPLLRTTLLQEMHLSHIWTNYPWNWFDLVLAWKVCAFLCGLRKMDQLLLRAHSSFCVYNWSKVSMEFIPCRNRLRNEELLQLMVGYRCLEVIQIVTIYFLTIHKMQKFAFFLPYMKLLNLIIISIVVLVALVDLFFVVDSFSLSSHYLFIYFYFFCFRWFSSFFAHSFRNVFFILTPKILGEKPNITKTIDKRNKQNKKSFLENVLWCFHFTKNKL